MPPGRDMDMGSSSKFMEVMDELPFVRELVTEGGSSIEEQIRKRLIGSCQELAEYLAPKLVALVATTDPDQEVRYRSRIEKRVPWRSEPREHPTILRVGSLVGCR